MNAFTLLVCYLAGINAAGLLLTGIDKRRAKRHAYRIPEATLFLVAIAGGSIGCIVGMYVFRHKTKHPSFVIGMPLILVVQLLMTFVLWRFVFQITFI
ncbi:MAG: DUF1294 domain-containing protein [Lachnospiraceae bacterium]|nr:DUF1294 domain-containing protein [Lachnospiraceae bacterium]